MNTVLYCGISYGRKKANYNQRRATFALQDCASESRKQAKI